MSGGAYDYGYCNLDRYTGELEDPELNELLKDFRDILYELEWYKSGDTSREDYQEAVKKFKLRWLISENIAEDVIIKYCDELSKYCQEVKDRLQNTKED